LANWSKNREKLGFARQSVEKMIGFWGIASQGLSAEPEFCSTYAQRNRLGYYPGMQIAH
jgi:hypothetical protein